MRVVRVAYADDRGQGVEQRGLAGVGVADQPDREVLGVALLDGPALAGLDALQLAGELLLAPLHEPPVDLELLLARAARADAAG